MKIAKGIGKTKLTVVCCLHGNEVFGEKVFQYFAQNIAKYPELRLLLANTKALNEGIRCIDEDLNRSFPGKPNGNYEQRLASRMLNVIEKGESLLDIHTTTSKVRMIPIVTNLGKGTKRVLNCANCPEIVFMGKKMGSHSLIGQMRNGVSLELGIDFANSTEAFEEIRSIIIDLLNGRGGTITPRKVFHVSGTIPNDTVLPENASNFKFIKELDVYPFLLDEESYTEMQGFAAREYEVIDI